MRGMYTTPAGHEKTAGNTHGAIFSEGETNFLLSLRVPWRITALMSLKNTKSEILLEIMN